MNGLVGSPGWPSGSGDSAAMARKASSINTSATRENAVVQRWFFVLFASLFLFLQQFGHCPPQSGADFHLCLGVVIVMVTGAGGGDV